MRGCPILGDRVLYESTVLTLRETKNCSLFLPAAVASKVESKQEKHNIGPPIYIYFYTKIRKILSHVMF